MKQSTIDERCAEIFPHLRGRWGLELPECVRCGRPMVLVDTAHVGPGRWLHDVGRDPGCVSLKDGTFGRGEVEPFRSQLLRSAAPRP